jgi:hypothetical protein
MIDQYGNIASPSKKKRRRKYKKLKEPLTPRERANLSISNQIEAKMRNPIIIPLSKEDTSHPNSRVLVAENEFQVPDDLSDKIRTTEYSPNPHNLTFMIPQFATSKTNYAANHGCRKLNRLYCDNSQNFISQCGISANTNCQMLDMIVDCRKVMAYNFYLKGVGMKYVKYSMFGPSSKCVRIKDKDKTKSAVCMAVQCDPTGTGYWMIFPNDVGISFTFFQFVIFYFECTF